MLTIEVLEYCIELYRNKDVKVSQLDVGSDLAYFKRGGVSCFLMTKETLDFSKENKKSLNFLSILQYLRETLGLSGHEGLQIIGDSGCFSQQSDDYVYRKLKKALSQHKGPVFYGFTSNNHGGANGVLTRLIEKSEVLTHQVLANIVYPTSIKAIKEWGCTYSEKIKNFFIVHSAVDCNFGDDIYLSDNLARKLICLEGGVISFCQLVNTLTYHVNPDVMVLSGLRDKNEEAWFSAAELIKKLKVAKEVDELARFKDEYLEELALYDPKGKRPCDEILKKKREDLDEAFLQLVAAEGILDKIKAVIVEDYNTLSMKPRFFKEATQDLPSSNIFSIEQKAPPYYLI